MKKSIKRLLALALALLIMLLPLGQAEQEIVEASQPEEISVPAEHDNSKDAHNESPAQEEKAVPVDTAAEKVSERPAEIEEQREAVTEDAPIEETASDSVSENAASNEIEQTVVDSESENADTSEIDDSPAMAAKERVSSGYAVLKRTADIFESKQMTDSIGKISGANAVYVLERKETADANRDPVRIAFCADGEIHKAWVYANNLSFGASEPEKGDARFEGHPLKNISYEPVEKTDADDAEATELVNAEEEETSDDVLTAEEVVASEEAAEVELISEEDITTELVNSDEDYTNNC